MNDISQGLIDALWLIVSLDADLLEIIFLSLQVSLSAVALSAAIGLPLGAILAISAFPGRRAFVVMLNALMGLPPVVVGLFVYLMLSRSGPLGILGLLFTPTAMIIAQTILITPIVAAFARQTIAHLWSDYRDLLVSLDASKRQALATLLWDGRVALATAVLAGFGRAIAEVGAVMIVGGNIEHVTRVLTTAIALETSKGNLAMAMGLGIVLIALALTVNALVHLLSGPDTGEVR